ncbi:MAG: thioesterase family protein [Bacteroidetes bacterium]|nr:thioesterase family protein [Bacteroidota bacterium]
MARIKIEFPETGLFTTEIKIRISDINYGGHLGHDAVLSIAHEARMRFLASLGYSEMDVEGAAIIMNDAAVVYRSEAVYGEVLRVDVGAADAHRKGCDLLYRISATDGREVALVKTGIMFFDYASRRPVSAPLRALEQFGLVTE